MAVDSKSPIEEGDLVGGIEIEKLIGTGGFGLVYRGKDPRGVPVAVKILRTEAASDAEMGARLMKEANLLSEIDHPNVVGFHAAGIDGRMIYLAMEYVGGGTLRDRLPKGRPIEVEQALRWARQIAEGCAALHTIHDAKGRPAVHRDLKPENVLLSRDGVAKVTDFGIAKFRTSLQSTRSNERIGTPHYMPPEQMDPTADVDERVDVFALGVIAYEMLAGMRPAEVGSRDDLTLMELVTRTLAHAAVPLPEINPDVPGYVGEIVGRMLEKKREQRFPTMRATADALAEALKRFRKERGRKPYFAHAEGVAEPGLVTAIPTEHEPSATRYVDPEANPSRALALATTDHDPAQRPSGSATLSATSRSSKELVKRKLVSPVTVVVGVVFGAAIGVFTFSRITSGTGAPASGSALASVPSAEASAPPAPSPIVPATAPSVAPPASTPSPSPAQPAPAPSLGPKKPPSGGKSSPKSITPAAPSTSVARPAPAPTTPPRSADSPDF